MGRRSGPDENLRGHLIDEAARHQEPGEEWGQHDGGRANGRHLYLVRNDGPEVGLGEDPLVVGPVRLAGAEGEAWSVRATEFQEIDDLPRVHSLPEFSGANEQLLLRSL